jgi:two-component system sensor histidine kinase MprB
MTLRARIAAVASLSVALAVLAAAVGVYIAVRADLRGQVDSSLRQRARGLAGPGPGGPNAGVPSGAGSAGAGNATGGRPGAVEPNGGPMGGDGDGDGGFPGRVQPPPFGAAPGYVQFISPAGAVMVPGGQGASARIDPSARDLRIAAAGGGSTLSDRTVEDTRLRVLTLGAGARGAVLVALPLAEVDHELGRLELLLALIGGAGIVLAAVLGTLVARTALAPIARFTKRTEQLTARTEPAGCTERPTGRVERLTGGLDLTQRLEVSGRDELARLADSFNATLAALERSVQAQRNLIADAGHELRTPIASLRANIQVLGEAEHLPPAERESLRRDIVEELDELTALVGDVVELARGAERKTASDEVRLDELVRAAVERARRRGEQDSEPRFELRVQPTVVDGDPTRIDRAVSNLLENARKWSPPQEAVEVELRAGELTVRDRGPGFQARDLPFVFDRFYRAADARKLPGSGLGLAIVRQAAEAHGGYAHAENAPGGGALLRVSFGPPLHGVGGAADARKPGAEGISGPTQEIPTVVDE